MHYFGIHASTAQFGHAWQHKDNKKVTYSKDIAGGTGEPLVGLEPTQLVGETAESGEDRLAGETVIEVLAGHS